jgi:hypothetical protein
MGIRTQTAPSHSRKLRQLPNITHNVIHKSVILMGLLLVLLLSFFKRKLIFCALRREHQVVCSNSK